MVTLITETPKSISWAHSKVDVEAEIQGYKWLRVHIKV